VMSLIGRARGRQPDEVYNPRDIQFFGLSWKQPELTGEIAGIGVLRILEAIRVHTQNDMSKLRFNQEVMTATVTRPPGRRTCPARHELVNS
jgi:GDPmannose 4,6-dehydratase